MIDDASIGPGYTIVCSLGMTASLLQRYDAALILYDGGAMSLSKRRCTRRVTYMAAVSRRAAVIYERRGRRRSAVIIIATR